MSKWQLLCAALQTCFHSADVSAGEGYECTVTVDDEDSKIIVFDNWKQVSCCPNGCCVVCASAYFGLLIRTSGLWIHGSDSHWRLCIAALTFRALNEVVWSGGDLWESESLSCVSPAQRIKYLLKSPNPSSRACLSIRGNNHPCVCCLSPSASAKLRLKSADEWG